MASYRVTLYQMKIPSESVVRLSDYIVFADNYDDVYRVVRKTLSDVVITKIIPLDMAPAQPSVDPREGTGWSIDSNGEGNHGRAA